jgi:HAE1 family hydrophobic/amphiphilic exporter-1
VALLTVGVLTLQKMPLELFPDVTFPIVTVTTVYPGAGPDEVETLVSKPIEEQLSTIGGTKVIRSINREGISVVIAEFNLDVDVKFAEQQVRDKVSASKRKLPDDIEEPFIRRIDPSAQPVVVLAIKSNYKDGKLYDIANEVIRPKIESVNQVGSVEVIGVRKREIQIQLDRDKLQSRELSVQRVASALQRTGENIPAGKLTQGQSETVYRTLGEFNSLDQVKSYLISFFGNDIGVSVSDVGQVVDTMEDEKMRAYLDGEPSALLNVYKQSGANTVKVSDQIQEAVRKLNEAQVASGNPEYEIRVVRDLSRFIRNNILDVTESIGFGIILTVLVVFLFLGSARSTIITGLAIPVSLIGAIPFLYAAGLTINIMTLLAFSLAVGLLIDDAIVVRENIYRHMQMGKSAIRAAIEGTSEVSLAVIAVTLAVISVFGPIAFLSGVVGMFFRSFGLGVVFVMIISLFDALTNASMLSAYFGGSHTDLSEVKPTARKPVQALLVYFDRLQIKLEKGYETFLEMILRNKIKTMGMTLVVVALLGYTANFIPKTFLPPQDSGEFSLSIDLTPGSSLEEMNEVALKIEKELQAHPEVSTTILSVGDQNGRSYVADFYVKLTPFGKRSKTTTMIKDEVREILKPFAMVNPKVKDVDFIGEGQRPFVINIRGQNLDEVKAVSNALFEKLKTHPGLLEPEINDKPGLPEFRVKLNERAQLYGITPVAVGAELRAQLEGVTPAKFRENGVEYDIRVRLQDDQRNLETTFNETKVPNINGRLVRLGDFSTPIKEVGAATVNREDRSRYISIQADVKPTGPGMGGVIQDINTWMSNGEIPKPEGVTYRFVGQAENFQELAKSIVIAGILAVVFLYLVLASLYESLVTPFTIMLVIPLAVFGGFFGLFVMNSSLDLFSMIGCIMLMGLATKNSIIMVDYINQKIAEGNEISKAIIIAGKTRLRPIIMTSLALIAGMMPVAIGLNEASTQRKSLGIAVVGGVAVSTLLTLIVIPVMFSYIERARRFMIEKVGSKIVNTDSAKH